MFDFIFKKSDKEVETWKVTTECPIFWPNWAYDFLINNPYTSVLPGDVLRHNLKTGHVYKEGE